MFQSLPLSFAWTNDAERPLGRRKAMEYQCYQWQSTKMLREDSTLESPASYKFKAPQLQEMGRSFYSSIHWASAMPRLCKCTKASETSTKIDAACQQSTKCRLLDWLQESIPSTDCERSVYICIPCLFFARWPPRVPNNAVRGSCCRGSRQEPLSFVICLIQRSARNDGLMRYVIYIYII